MINFTERELERPEFIGDESISHKTGLLARHHDPVRRRGRRSAFVPLILTSILLIFICYCAIEVFKFTMGQECVRPFARLSIRPCVRSSSVRLFVLFACCVFLLVACSSIFHFVAAFRTSCWLHAS